MDTPTPPPPTNDDSGTDREIVNHPPIGVGRWTHPYPEWVVAISEGFPGPFAGSSATGWNLLDALRNLVDHMEDRLEQVATAQTEHAIAWAARTPADKTGEEILQFVARDDESGLTTAGEMSRDVFDQIVAQGRDLGWVGQ